MSHRRAVLTMIVVTLMWSTAGVVTRHLEAARSFEVTFWRSAFTTATLTVGLAWLRGRSGLTRSLRRGGVTLWVCGVCWCTMFTAFMVALTMTSVANVLVTMSIAPVFTALISRAVTGQRLAVRTGWAIALAGAGIVWMYAREVTAMDARHVWGTLVALCVPVAAAVNWAMIQRSRGAADVDLLPAVLIGAALSCLVTLPWALPFAASAHDLALLAFLGIVQLSIPCLLSVSAARHLSAPQASLLALLEVLFGVLWAWWGAGEVPAGHVLAGGALVLTALAGNEALALREGGAGLA